MPWAACAANGGVAFVVNGSQGIGAVPIDVRGLPVDALVSCGYKWLCGPYGTGFAWMTPALRERLCYEQAYWLNGVDRGALESLAGVEDHGVPGYDVFCPASFLNSRPWLAALDVLLDAGIERIAVHDQDLVGRLLDGLGPERWELVSPAAPPARSTLVLFRPRGDELTGDVRARLSAAGVDVAERNGCVRISPHAHNTVEDIDRALDVLDRRAPTDRRS
jgi:cysteine desulfurase / selenocysteine lyase